MNQTQWVILPECEAGLQSGSELSMPTGSVSEALCTRGTFRKNNPSPRPPLGIKRGLKRLIPLPVYRSSIGQHASLRKRGNLNGELLCRSKRLADRIHSIGQAHAYSLIGTHGPAGQN